MHLDKIMDKNAEEIGQVSNEKTTDLMNSFIIFWSSFISPYPTNKLRINCSTTNVLIMYGFHSIKQLGIFLPLPPCMGC